MLIIEKENIESKVKCEIWILYWKWKLQKNIVKQGK